MSDPMIWCLKCRTILRHTILQGSFETCPNCAELARLFSELTEAVGLLREFSVCWFRSATPGQAETLRCATDTFLARHTEIK